MPKYLNIEAWNRKDQFYFFKNYDNPFFNICSDLDISELYKFVKNHGISFFSASLYLSLRSANDLEEFHYRIRGDKVIIYEIIDAGSTVLNEDETFSFCYFKYFSNFQKFDACVSQKLQENQAKGGKLDPQDFRDDLIHYSIIPWISFSSVSHPRKFNQEDSIPKIVFGKYHHLNDTVKMPISIEVHHALMDGIHVAKYLDFFQDYMNEPGKILKFEI